MLLRLPQRGSGAPHRVGDDHGVVPDVLTPCEGCGRQTKTIVGRCPECGFAKGAVVIRQPRRDTWSDGFWDGLGNLLGTTWGASMLGGLIVLVGWLILDAIAS